MIPALVSVLVLVVADPANAAPGKPGFPLPSWTGIVTWFQSPVWGPVPQQDSGTADGKSHAVPASATRAGRGAGQKPGKGQGELAEYTPYQRPPKTGASGDSKKGVFDARTSVMDGKKSSATVSWFDNADGSFTRKVSEHPVNYQTATGQWASIDTSLAKDAKGRYAEKANSIGVSFAGHAAASDDLASVTVAPGQSVGFSLAGAADAKASVSGATVTYPNVLPDTTLIEQGGPTGDKESIVLASAAAGNSWTFPLHTAGLNPSLDADGSVVFKDDRGEIGGRIPLAYAYDSNYNQWTGDSATTWNVKYALSSTGSGYDLTVTVDPAWLNDPARVFPVTADPTLYFSTTGTVSTTYVTTDAAGDYSSDTVIKDGDCTAQFCGYDTKATSFLKFPTFPTGQGYGITSASLVMFDTWTAVTAGTQWCAPASNFNWSFVRVAPVTQAWSVVGSKAYPGPSFGDEIGEAEPETWNACTNTTHSLTIGDWVSVPIYDLTYLNDWSFNQQPNDGLAVYGDLGSLSWRKFDSDMESSYSPYLQVTYVDQAPQVNSQYPPNGYAAPTLTPELLASASRPSGSTTSTALTYDFTVYQPDGTNAPTLVVDSGTRSTGDWTVPAGKLKWGTTYYWTVTSSDGTLTSVPQPYEALTIAVPQPLVTSSLSQSGDKHGYDEATGNYTTSATDAEVSTVGPKLQIVRDYNARDPRTTGAFGAAWSSVFDAQATEQKDATGAVTSVIVTYPDGSQVGFGKNSDGTFSPPSGRFAMLRSVTGGYTLTDKNDTTYTFGQALGGSGSGPYGITSVADANNRALNFTWSSGAIATMTSAASGRALHLTWSTPAGAGSPHVATVYTDPVTGTDQSTDLTWKYFYTGDRLVDVCDPTQSPGCTGGSGDVGTRYAYTNGSQYQSALLDAGVQSLWTLSEARGTTAASAVIANQGNDNGTYNNVTLGAAGPIGASTATAASFNGTSSNVKLPGNLVASASYQSVGLWFKTSSAGVLLSYQADQVTAGTTAGNYTPALYVGTSGKLYGQFWQGGVSPMVYTPNVADGAWHYVVLSAAGNTQSMYVDGSVVGPLAGTVVPFPNGTTSEYIGAGFWGGAWPDEPHYTTSNNTGYADSFNGSIADVSFFTKPLFPPDVTALRNAATHTASLMTTITRPSGKTADTVNYDGATARVTSVVDENGGTWTLNTPFVKGTSESYRAAVMGSAPAGYYRLGDTAGASNAYSEVNYGMGTYHNVSLGTPGPFSDRTAATFDGTSSYLSLPASDQVTTGPNSVEMWFKMTAGSTGGGVLFDEMGQPMTSSNPECCGWNPAVYVGTDGRLHGEFWINDTSKVMASPGLVNDGNWHHVVLSAATNAQNLYLDGNEVGSAAGNLSPTAQGFIYVGAGECDGGWPFHPTNTLGYFPGSIAEVAFYRTQLSAAEVSAHYAAYKSGSGVAPVKVAQVNDPGATSVPLASFTGTGTSFNASQNKTWTGTASQLQFQSDGNLVLKRVDTGAVIWSSNTWGNPNALLGFQTDGNLVIYSTPTGGTALWSSGTWGYSGDSAALRPNGNITINDANGIQRWSAGVALTDAPHVLTSVYDADNGDKLISQTDGTGATTSYGYDTSGFLHTSTDAMGDVTTTGHDVRGNTVSQTTCQNQAAQQCSTEYFTYWPDDITPILTTADPRNDLTTSFRDGRSTSATDTTYATTYNYDAAGDRTSFTTPPVAGFPSGRTTAVTYSDGTASFPAADTGNVPAGLPMSTVSPGGSVSRVAYLHNGDVASTTDADGLVTLYTYDGVGRVLTKTVNPGKPVGWWPLNQTSGTAVPDASGTGNGANASNVTWSGGAAVLNGTNSTVTANGPVVNTAASYTLSAWVNMTSSANNPVFVGIRGDHAFAGALSFSPGAATFKFQMDGSDIAGAPGTLVAAKAPPVYGTWYHLVGEYDASSSTMLLYVNGVLNGSATVTGAWAGTHNLTIGSTGASAFLNGSMANVQVYQRALSASDVAALYAAGYTGNAYANTTPGGLVTSLTYDGVGQVTSQTDPQVTDRVTGAVHTAKTTTTFDVDGDIISQAVTDSAAGGDASRTVSSTYNSHDQLATSTDANGNVTTMSYDGYGNLVSQTAPDGTVNNSTYDAEGRLLTQTLSNYTGDPVNPSSPRPLTEVSRAYDPAGRLASLTDAMGNVTKYTYTDNGLIATVTKTDPNGTNSSVLQSITYDAAGNAINKVTGNGALTTATTVDAADRSVKVVEDPNGTNRTTTVSYTPNDEVATTTETDATGYSRTASYTYDPLGNKTSQSVNLDGSGHPVGWWNLTQSTGNTVTDASGTGNTAYTNTGVTWTGSGASFNGSSAQQISTNGPVLNTATSYSVSAWVNLASTASYYTAVSQGGANMGAFYLQYSPVNGSWAFVLPQQDSTSAPQSAARATAPPAVNTWTHLVGVYDSSSSVVRLYVNGVQVDFGNLTTPWSASGPLSIGGLRLTNGTTSNGFLGQVANVQVYQRALSASEVSTLYGAGRTSGTVASSALQTTSWRRDVRGLPISMTDPNGNTTGYTYDEAGHLAVTVAPTVSAEVYGSTPVSVHPVTTDGYNTFGEETEQQDPNGNITTTVYDANGNRVSQTLPPYTPPGSSTPITASTVWTYDKTGNLTSESDALNNTTHYTYDQVGDRATVTTPDGGVTHYVYDDNGERLSTTDPTGAQTQATYDWMGRQITSTVLERYPSAQTLVTTYSYASSATNPGGVNLASVTSPDSSVTSYGYDATGELTSTTDAFGNTTSRTYNFMGDTHSITYPDGTSAQFHYDTAERPIQLKTFDAAGALISTTGAYFDAAGNMLSSTDARGNTTTYTYDATGMMTQEVQPVTATSSITTSFGYDATGNRTRYTDGRGNNWYTTYNSWGLKQSQVEPATSTYTSAADSTTTYAYDADARPTTVTLPGGLSQSFSYDNMGDVLSQSGTGAGAATATRTFTYDPAGRVRTAATSNTGGASDNSTAETFTYNDRGGLLTATGSAGSTSLAYNGDGLLASRTDASGTATYTYDVADRVLTASDPTTNTTLAYEYNAMSQVKSVAYGSGQNVRSFGYDSSHRLATDVMKTASGATVSSIGYGYDPNGNLTSKTTSGFATSAANTYTYDNADRLTSWNNGATTVNYAYDAAGNRVQVGSNVFSYDARDQLTSDGVNSYSYTAAGTLASQTSSGGTTAYKFDAYGQAQTAGTAAYTYDALGRVIQRTNTATSGGVALQYSGAGNLVASDGGFVYSRDATGGLLGVNTAGGSTSTGRLALTDLHTDVVGTFAANGSILSGSTTYDPLGNTIGTNSRLGNLGYQSEYTDPTLGQVNMAARWYNPATGQFISKDTVQVNPVGNSAAANPFAYAGDDPMTGTDPSGHWSLFSAAKSAWHATTNAVSSAWNAASSYVSSAWNSAYDFVQDDIIRPAEHIYQAYVAPVVNTVVHKATAIVHKVKDVYHRTVRRVTTYVHKQVARAKAAVRHVTKAATHVVKTAYHAAAKATKTAATFVKNHAATIVSFAVSTVAFMGCEAALGAVTGGVGAIAGATVCGAFSGMVGGLVDQAAKCIGGTKGSCSPGSFVKAGVTGLVVGAATGALGGVGGKLLGKLAPKALDVFGGLFGKGAAEAADAGATDGAEAAGEAETHAATESAQSSVDNAGAAAKTAEKPKSEDIARSVRRAVDPSRPKPEDLRAGTGVAREMPEAPEVGDPNEASDAAEWVEKTGDAGYNALPPRPGAVHAEVAVPSGPSPVIRQAETELPVGSEMLGVALFVAAAKKGGGIVVKGIVRRLTSGG